MRTILALCTFALLAVASSSCMQPGQLDGEQLDTDASTEPVGQATEELMSAGSITNAQFARLTIGSRITIQTDNGQRFTGLVTGLNPERKTISVYDEERQATAFGSLTAYVPGGGGGATDLWWLHALIFVLDIHSTGHCDCNLGCLNGSCTYPACPTCNN